MLMFQVIYTLHTPTAKAQEWFTSRVVVKVSASPLIGLGLYSRSVYEYGNPENKTWPHPP